MKRNPNSPPRPLPPCPPDPPEPHHIPSCLPQLHTGHTLNNTPGRWRSHLPQFPVHSSSQQVHGHTGLGNWDWRRDFSWLWFNRHNLLDVIICHLLSPGRAWLCWTWAGRGHFGAELSLLLFVFGAPPDLFCVSLFTLKSSATARKKWSSWLLRGTKLRTI